jgi:hypothetical protein
MMAPDRLSRHIRERVGESFVVSLDSAFAEAVVGTSRFGKPDFAGRDLLLTGARALVAMELP